MVSTKAGIRLYLAAKFRKSHSDYPAIEAEFPAIAKPEARFLVGHSLGGWSALSLLVDHPQKFAGAWALAPDPVDFQDFYGVDLYASRANLYVDQRGLERYLARVGGRGAVTFRTQAAFEEIVGTGNLLQSWEAMLSPRGVDGEPRPMFDRVTGAIDGNVVQQWSRHDIHRKLAANWNRDGRYLAGKIHIKVGDADNYWLHRPLVGLAESLDAWKADAQVEFLPGLDHLALDAVPIHRQVQREIEAMWENRAR